MSEKTKLLETFIAASRLPAKNDCAVARQNFSLLANVHDCETNDLDLDLDNDND